jgi:hypothetical protein
VYSAPWREKKRTWFYQIGANANLARANASQGSLQSLLTPGGSPRLSADIAEVTSGASGTFIYETGGLDAGTPYWDPSGGSADDAIALAKLINLPPRRQSAAGQCRRPQARPPNAEAANSRVSIPETKSVIVSKPSVGRLKVNVSDPAPPGSE